MTAPAAIAGLSAIADRYDVVLCDVWGVIHNGRESFPEAREALARFQAERGPVVLLTNAPRPSAQVRDQLALLSVSDASYSDVTTSGDATRALLGQHAPGPAWMLGPPRDAPLYDGLPVEFAALEAARFIACTGPFDDDVETPEDYRDLFEGAVARGLPMICANPDIVVRKGDRLIYCGGALAQLYEQMGGEVLMAGKPYGPIYDLALARAEVQLGRTVDRTRILCIGDGLPTDVKGANLQALDVLFIAAGIHGEGLVGPEGLDPAATEAMLAEDGLQAAWAMPDLVW